LLKPLCPEPEFLLVGRLVHESRRLCAGVEPKAIAEVKEQQSIDVPL
jgi:hypothetical protein